jgi:hypothetical protein
MKQAANERLIAAWLIVMQSGSGCNQAWPDGRRSKYGIADNGDPLFQSHRK